MRAHEKVDEILSSQKGPGISLDEDKAFNELFKIISKRSYDDFQKAEGLEKSDSTSSLSGLEG